MPNHTFEEIAENAGEKFEGGVPSEKPEETPAPVDYTKITVDMDGLPDDLKGKSVSDVVTRMKGLQEALRMSEQARLQTPAPVAAPSQPAQPAAEPELTEEKLREMYDEDPLKAMEAKIGQHFKRLESIFTQRVAPLQQSGVSATEAQIRQRFPDEFEALGKEISDFVAQLPDKSALANPEVYERVVKYVRGEHLEKLLSHREGKTKQKDLENARRGQQREVPPNLSQNSGGQRLDAPLDDLQKEVARTLGMSESDYRKYYM